MTPQSIRPSFDPPVLQQTHTNTPSPSNPAKPGHIQLSNLQKRLNSTPLSNPLLSENTRNELETQLILMVRWKLEKTTPAYQEEAAHLITHNWPHLSKATQTLIEKLCRKHLEESTICPHYRSALTHILNAASPSSPETIEPLNSPEAAPNTTSLPFSAQYKRGSRMRLFGGNSHWHTLKTQIKEAYVSTQWNNFLNGTHPNDAHTALKETMAHALHGLENKTKLRSQAEKYILKKSAKPMYQLDSEGRGFFRTKGTTLSSRVYRTGGNFYKLLNHVSKETRQTIQAQQGKHYTGTTFLGSGAAGRVQLAERFKDGERHIVAAKISNATEMLKNEHTMLNTLPLDKPYFSTIRDFVENPKKPQSKAHEAILFMDFQARGTLLSVMNKLGKIQTQSVREESTRSVAKQLVEAVQSMHAQEVSHRDLKPENILLSNQGALVITDLGTATQQETLTCGFSGTMEYAAPEELNETRGRNPKLADRYSLGQVLFNVLKASGLPKGTREAPHPLWAISNALINPAAADRPAPEDILTRPFMQGKTYSGPELLHILNTGKAPTPQHLSQT